MKAKEKKNLKGIKKLVYSLKSGKNIKLFYYAANYFRYYAEPKWMYRARLRRLLNAAKKRPDYDYIRQRVDYYCKLSQAFVLPEGTKRICDYRPTGQKVYFFDTFRYSRWFPARSKLSVLPGDIIHVPDVPSVVKSRPLCADNENSVVLKLDRVRHFIFVNDQKPWTAKMNRAIFMGKINKKPERIDFMHKYFGTDICDCGNVDRIPYAEHPEWKQPKKTISEHLDYKFIMALEGNDVASNLKWVMSSNSLAVMPRPTCETWFMEGTLIPNYHYVEIMPDFSDLREKMEYYISHPDEAQAIIDHAHEYVAQFKNRQRENLISLLVLDKYFHFASPIHKA